MVDCILDKKVIKGKTKYLIKWDVDGSTSWEPVVNVPFHLRKSFKNFT